MSIVVVVVVGVAVAVVVVVGVAVAVAVVVGVAVAVAVVVVVVTFQFNRKETMKKLVEVTEVSGEGLTALLGEVVTIFCLNYIYTGKLTGVNDSFVLLESASIVYETGAFDEKNWKDAQKLPKPLYVMTSSIESFTILK